MPVKLIFSFAARTAGTAALLVLALAVSAAAQNPVQIVRADSIVGTNTQGEIVQRVLGNVHMRTEEMDLYADSAYRYSSRDMVQAFGNIEINTQQENIWADTLTYYTDIDFSELRGRVIIESDSSTLYGNSVDYRFTNKVAHFRDKIRLEDPQGVLIANSGFYFRRADSATFRGQVQLRDSLKYIEGDSLFTNRSKEYYELHGRVFADDPENNSMLMGDYLEADSTGRRLLEGRAWLKNYRGDTTRTQAGSDRLAADSLRPPSPAPPAAAGADSLAASRPDTARIWSPDSGLSRPDSLQPVAVPPDTAGASSSQPDTTHIRARRILSVSNRTASDTTTTVHAYQNVRIWSPDFSSVSDTARYESRTESFEVWSDARAWHEQIQLTGPYIWVKLDEGDIEELHSYPDPFTVQQDTSIDRLNQIKGDTLTAQFSGGDLQRIRVYQNSHLLRFTQQDGEPDGVLELRAPETLIFFEDGTLVEVKSLGRQELVKGNYLPETPDIADKKLDGFAWDPDLRPRRPEERMQPRFGPIPEDPPFELPRRYRLHIGRADSTAAPADSLQPPPTEQ